MENPIWYAFEPILCANSSKDYRKSVTDYCTSLVSFLYDKSLLKFYPLNEDRIIKTDLIIHKNDLTEAGQYLFTSGAIYKERKTFKHLETALAKYEQMQKG